MRTFPFLSSDSVAYDPVKTKLWESEAEAPANRKARNRTLLLVYSFKSGMGVLLPAPSV